MASSPYTDVMILASLNWIGLVQSVSIVRLRALLLRFRPVGQYRAAICRWSPSRWIASGGEVVTALTSRHYGISPVTNHDAVFVSDPLGPFGSNISLIL